MSTTACRVSSRAESHRRCPTLAAGQVCESLEQRLLLSADLLAQDDPVIIAPPLAVTVHSLTTDKRFPQLTGEVTDPDASVYVTINGGMYRAINNGDGTWTLPEGEIGVAVVPGVYDVSVLGVDANFMTASDSTTNELTVILTVAVDRLAASSFSPAITGRISQPAAVVWVQIAGGAYVATNMGDGTWILPASVLAPLTFGTYEVDVLAQLDGIIVHDTTNNELSIVPISISADRVKTYKLSPQLTGTVSDPTADISVTISGVNYDAINDGDGTWTLPEGTIQPLSLGTFDIRVQAINAERFIGADTRWGGLQIVPFVSIDHLTTSSTSPQLEGFIVDPTLDIYVTVAGKTYQAENLGNERWVLPAGAIDPSLSPGTYDVLVEARNDAGQTVDTDSTREDLQIVAPSVGVVVFPLTTALTSPVISGMVTDRSSSVSVVVNGVTYPAYVTSAGDWYTVGAVGPLDEGTYDVQAIASMGGDIVGADTTFNELRIDTGLDPVLQTLLDSDNRRMTFVDSQGNVVVVRLRGPGVVTIDRQSDAVTHQGDIVTITVDNSTLSTSLSISVYHGASTALQNIVINGAIGSVSAPDVNVLGVVQIDNGIRKLVLGDLLGDNSLNIGWPIPETLWANITLGNVTDASIASRENIRSLHVTNWTDTGLVADSVKAPVIQTLHVTGSRTSAGNFAADLVLAGLPSGRTLGSAAIRGNLSDATWDITGDVGSVTVGGAAIGFNLSTHSSISSIKVAQWLADSTINSDGSIGKITVGGLDNADIFAGLAGVDPPASAADFDVPSALIGKVMVTGAVKDADGKSTLDARIASPQVGSVALRDMQADNGGEPFGVWALSTQTPPPRITLREGGLTYLFPDEPPVVGDWTVQLV